jgi:hypothetical protein
MVGAFELNWRFCIKYLLIYTSQLIKAARLKIHPNFYENFENVFKSKIL